MKNSLYRLKNRPVPMAGFSRVIWINGTGRLGREKEYENIGHGTNCKKVLAGMIKKRPLIFLSTTKPLYLS